MQARIARFCLLTAAVMYSAMAMAANMPPQLYNKAITVAFNTSSNSVAEDGSIGHGLSHQRIIYISSKGNVFVRNSRTGNMRNRAGRAASDDKDVAPEQTGGTYSYQGGRIVGFVKMLGGANLMTISFDPSFQSCTAAIQFGRSNGEEYKTKAPNGKIYTVQGAVTASTPTCSMRDGNPFAD